VKHFPARSPDTKRSASKSPADIRGPVHARFPGAEDGGIIASGYASDPKRGKLEVHTRPATSLSNRKRRSEIQVQRQSQRHGHGAASTGYRAALTGTFHHHVRPSGPARRRHAVSIPRPVAGIVEYFVVNKWRKYQPAELEIAFRPQPVPVPHREPLPLNEPEVTGDCDRRLRSSPAADTAQ